MRGWVSSVPLLLLFVTQAVATEGATVVLHDAGGAGEWAVYHDRFGLEPFAVVRGSFLLRVEPPADGPPRALFQAPATTYREGGASVFSGGLGAPRLATGIAGEALVIDLVASFGMYGAELDGYTMLVAANAPWSLDVTLRDVPGPVGERTPVVLARGGGATFAEAAGGALDALGVLQLPSLEVPVTTRGWSHVQLETSWRPLSIRDVTVDFPNGTPRGDTGVFVSTFALGPRGAEGPAAGQHWDSYGAMEDRVGTFRASVRGVEGGSPIRLTFAHLPMEPGALAPLAVGHYAGAQDRAYWTPPGTAFPDLP